MNNHNYDNYNTEISKSIFEVQENEKKRISRELHDAIMQELTYISHKLELLGLYIENDTDKANKELVHIKSALKKTMNEIRNIIFDLRPTILDDLGLKEALLVFINLLKENTTFDFIVDIDSIEADKDILLHIYRIVIECVMNAVKYSKGTQIKLLCKRNKDEIILCIEDDGIGFERNNITNTRVSHGLSIINERVKIMNGNFLYKTNIDEGLHIDITIPYEDKGAENLI